MSHHETTIVLSYALQSGLLLAVGLIVPELLRLRHPRTLLIYWRILLPVVVVSPLATALWQPKNPLPVLSIDGGMIEQVVATTLQSKTVELTWQTLLVPVLLVAAFGVVRIIIGFVYLDRCRRTATPLVPLPDRIIDLQSRLGLDVPIAATENLSVPITFGWARPIVMVPMSFNRLSADEQEGVACHELLHIHRRDWPVALAEKIVRALFWFHPAVWLVLPKIELCREQVVDAGTIELTGKRRQYLNALWQIVVSSHQPVAALAVPLIGKSHLRARVESLKKENAMSKSRVIASVAVLIASLVAASIVGATVFASSAPDGELHSIGTSWSTANEKPPAEKEIQSDKGSKLQTRDHEGECSELTDPETIEKVSPTYPPEAKKAKIMGKVVLGAIISDKGEVGDLEILESPDELLTQAALDAVKQWRFRPAQCDGEAVDVYYVLTINFALN